MESVLLRILNCLIFSAWYLTIAIPIYYLLLNTGDRKSAALFYTLFWPVMLPLLAPSVRDWWREKEG